MNELILSVDTTHEFGSLALLSSGELIEEVLLRSPEGFGQIIYGHLERLFESHACRVEDVVCFASASGPGSFTGVRVGLACVKGLAEATGKPVAAVSNLEALSCFGTKPLRAVMLDARRGEVYGAVYDENRRPLLPEMVMKFPVWLQTLPKGEVEFICTDFAPFHSALAGTYFQDAKVTTAPRALAAVIGRIAYERLQLGAAVDPAQIDANYVRRSDAELFWRE